METDTVQTIEVRAERDTDSEFVLISKSKRYRNCNFKVQTRYGHLPFTQSIQKTSVLLTENHQRYQNFHILDSARRKLSMIVKKPFFHLC